MPTLRFSTVLIGLLFLSLAGSAAATTVIWVSPDGRDDADGTQERPFATLVRARAAVRERVQQGLTDDIAVRLRGGDYRLTETLELTPADAGTLDHTVAYVAAEGERPVLKGSRVLAGTWERVDGTLWKLAVPEAAEGRWVFRNLFRDGKTLPRAREPDIGYYTLKSVDAGRRVATINELLPMEWSGIAGAELNTTAWWHFSRQPIERIDAAESRITARRPIGTDVSSFKFGNKGHERIWLENALPFADEPGEWFLDTGVGVLYLRAAMGEDPNNTVVSAPLLRELIVVRGDAKALVRNVRFAGLGFAETDWEMPDEGRLGVQAGAWAIDRSRTYTPGAALRFIFAWDTVVTHCTFSDLGEGGLSFEIGSRGGRVERNTFRRVGSNVVQVGRMPDYEGDKHPLHRDFSDWGDWADSLQSYPASQAIWLHTSQTVPEAPSKIQLIENSITDCCHLDYGSVGIWVGYANHVRIERNTLKNLPYTGINVGWRWGPGLTNCHSNLIVGNTIESVMRQVGDGAGIYLVGEQPGTRVIENFVRDSGGNYWAHGIYADESSDHMEIAGNYVQQVADHSIFMNRNGPNQTVRDNNGEVGPTILNGTDEKGRFWANFKPERGPSDSDRGIRKE